MGARLERRALRAVRRPRARCCPTTTTFRGWTRGGDDSTTRWTARWKRTPPPASGLGGTEIAGAERAARRLLEHNPLRETGYGLLMQALAARGNVAEALHVYERARTVLRDELGIPPGPAIHEIHAALLGRHG